MIDGLMLQRCNIVRHQKVEGCGEACQQSRCPPPPSVNSIAAFQLSIEQDLNEMILDLIESGVGLEGGRI